MGSERRLYANQRHGQAWPPFNWLPGLCCCTAALRAMRRCERRRDWATNITVLSGDLDGNDITDPTGVVTDTANIVGDNAYHVFVSRG